VTSYIRCIQIHWFHVLSLWWLLSYSTHNLLQRVCSNHLRSYFRDILTLGKLKIIRQMFAGMPIDKYQQCTAFWQWQVINSQRRKRPSNIIEQISSLYKWWHGTWRVYANTGPRITPSPPIFSIVLFPFLLRFSL
jgi:hypothetical protein